MERLKHCGQYTTIYSVALEHFLVPPSLQNHSFRCSIIMLPIHGFDTALARAHARATSKKKDSFLKDFEREIEVIGRVETEPDVRRTKLAQLVSDRIPSLEQVGVVSICHAIVEELMLIGRMCRIETISRLLSETSASTISRTSASWQSRSSIHSTWSARRGRPLVRPRLMMSHHETKRF